MPFLAEELYQNLVRSVDPAAPASVHLCDYPAFDPALADEVLLRDMAAVVRVVELGRAARTKAEVRVRQPLARLLVHTPLGDAASFASLTTLQDQVLDELNIKALAPMERPEDYVTYEIRPNLPLIGKKYGKQVPAIRAALASADAAAIARSAAAGEGVTLALLDGTQVTLAPEELLVDTRQRGGFAVAEDAGYVVALETELTAELRLEGLARDFVRLVQEARKNADLRIEDHIRVTYAVAPEREAAAAINAFAGFIAGETLADTLTEGEPEVSAHEETVTLGGESVRLGITRVTE